MRDAEGAVLGSSDSLEAAAKLTRSERYKDVMGRVRAALEGGAEEGAEEVAWTGPSEESPTYRYSCHWLLPLQCTRPLMLFQSQSCVRKRMSFTACPSPDA